MNKSETRSPSRTLPAHLAVMKLRGDVHARYFSSHHDILSGLCLCRRLLASHGVCLLVTRPPSLVRVQWMGSCREERGWETRDLLAFALLCRTWRSGKLALFCRVRCGWGLPLRLLTFIWTGDKWPFPYRLQLRLVTGYSLTQLVFDALGENFIWLFSRCTNVFFYEQFRLDHMIIWFCIFVLLITGADCDD